MKIKTFFLLLCTLSFWGSALAAPPQYKAEEVEPPHAKAIIHFNSARYDLALRVSEEILRTHPDYIPSLELKALCYRKLKNNNEAKRIYLHLIKLTDEKEDKAPYAFEVGTIHFELKNYTEAEGYFKASLKYGFNKGASHYFLGLILYQQEEYKKAEYHFAKVILSSATDLIPMSHFYLGIIYAKMGYGTGFLWAMKEADIGNSALENSSNTSTADAAKGILKVTREILTPIDRSRFYGYVNLSSQYDSNIASLPETVAVQQPANQKTSKINTTVGFGYITSPLKPIQVNVGYKGYYNYNLNQNAKGFSFFSSMPSATISFFPYKRTYVGAKLEGNLSYNDRQDGTQTVFSPFSFIGNFGPFIKFEYFPKWTFTYEVTYRPKHYYQDPSTVSYKRTGNGYLNKLAVDYFSKHQALNPSVYISQETDNTQGSEFNAEIISIGASNLFKLNSKENLTLAFDYASYSYNKRVPIQRNDRNHSYRVLFTHAFTNHLSVLLDMNYIRNLSTVPTAYQYNRFMSSVGVNLSL